MPARASFGLRFWNSGQLSSVSSSAERRRSCRRPITHSGKSPSCSVGDQLAEARVVLGEPVALGGQRLGEQRELLVGREVAVADDGRAWGR